MGCCYRSASSIESNISSKSENILPATAKKNSQVNSVSLKSILPATANKLCVLLSKCQTYSSTQILLSSFSLPADTQRLAAILLTSHSPLRVIRKAQVELQLHTSQLQVTCVRLSAELMGGQHTEYDHHVVVQLVAVNR